MTSPSVYDHVWLADPDYLNGVYRVVGVRDETVTLLRVADVNGRRVNSGEIVMVSFNRLAECSPAENPDGDRPLGEVVAAKLEMMYWSVRTFVRQLAAHPIPAAIAIAFVGIGALGDQSAQLPSVAQGALIIVGSLTLAYVGSGRL